MRKRRREPLNLERTAVGFRHPSSRTHRLNAVTPSSLLSLPSLPALLSVLADTSSAEPTPTPALPTAPVPIVLALNPPKPPGPPRRRVPGLEPGLPPLPRLSEVDDDLAAAPTPADEPAPTIPRTPTV